MRIVKFGILALLIITAALALLWLTEAVPRADVVDWTPKAVGAVLILMLAALAWSAIRGTVGDRDSTDKPVP